VLSQQERDQERDLNRVLTLGLIHVHRVTVC
jgi:hypothetical protein